VRFKVKKIIINFGILLLAFLLLQASAQAQQDEKLFQEAKILIFDKKWENAQAKLEELLEKYPKSPWFSQAVFYRAKCLEELGGKEVETLQAYMSYLELKDRSLSLSEESERAIINLAFDLYESGEKPYLQEMEKRLSSSNRVIRYYAAIKLSYVSDKKIATRAVPVLKEILEKERDEELRDRAKISLLKIDPDALKGFEEGRHDKEVSILKIRIFKEGKDIPSVQIDIPWALADLALRAFSDTDKQVMKKEGYDLDRILKELSEYEGKIVEIHDEESRTLIKIWIEKSKKNNGGIS
jgi:hypothetical protein